MATLNIDLYEESSTTSYLGFNSLAGAKSIVLEIKPEDVLLEAVEGVAIAESNLNDPMDVIRFAVTNYIGYVKRYPVGEVVIQQTPVEAIIEALNLSKTSKYLVAANILDYVSFLVYQNLYIKYYFYQLLQYHKYLKF